MRIPQQVHHVLHQVADEITINQNNGQISWFQGTLRVIVFEDDTFHCAVAQPMKFQHYAHTPFLVPLPPAYLPILAGEPVDQNSIWPIF
jgi:hypothetical protein